MAAMTLATFGWGTWWVALLWTRVAPESAPGIVVVGSIAIFFAVPGLVIAAMTVRSRRTWMLFSLVAIFANASLLAMPWLAQGIASELRRRG